MRIIERKNVQATGNYTYSICEECWAEDEIRKPEEKNAVSVTRKNCDDECSYCGR